MTLQVASIEWAMDYIATHSDGDLFPKVLEIEALLAEKDDFIAQIQGQDLSLFQPGACRRFIVPKDEFSYRQATQLDLQDSIILSALMYQFGAGIEAKRLPVNKVFSYRFQPTVKDGLYKNDAAWNKFWTTASTKSKSYQSVIYCDISDFYNQIYHHSVENQLISASFPNQASKWIIALLESTTAGVSRGVPIGPHPIHLLAEATLTPIDNSLTDIGIRFIRYADDMLVFCRNIREARQALAQIATVLDKQQRLTLQRHKTKIFEVPSFQNLCADMIQDRPVNSEEQSLLNIIQKYSLGNPYKSISYDQISASDWAKISGSDIKKIIEEYISKENVDYIRLRWFYRRLAQIGHPGAIEVSLEKLDQLGPCFSNVCFYLASVQSISPKDWKAIGTKLLKLLKKSEVSSSEYFRLSIVSLFTRNPYIDHFDKLSRLFQKSDPHIRREIILASKANAAYDWVREHKESFASMDPWQQRAYIFACSGLPKDERKFFINRWKTERPIDKVIAKWSKSI